MNPSRQAITHERRRYVQVRKAFETGLEPEQSASPEFYLACGDYMVFATQRSHAQGQRIHDRLKARVPAGDIEAHAALDHQDELRRQGLELMGEFYAAVEELRSVGESGVSAFVGEARDFNRAFNALMAPRKNPFSRYTDELFDDADWIEIAATTDDSITTEERLFAAVCETAPAGIDPDAMTVEHK